jgi:hypothetical protein
MWAGGKFTMHYNVAAAQLPGCQREHADDARAGLVRTFSSGSYGLVRNCIGLLWARAKLTVRLLRSCLGISGSMLILHTLDCEKFTVGECGLVGSSQHHASGCCTGRVSAVAC